MQTDPEMRRILCLSTTALMLSGCGLPPALQIASLALDGLSLISTGKSTTDHAVSTVRAEDCALHRSLKGQEVCRDKLDEMAQRTGKQ